MAFCKNCGSELVEGAAFCMKCGSKVDGAQATSAAPAASNTQWRSGIVKYKHLYIVDGCDLVCGKVKNCECCKKPFTGLIKNGNFGFTNFTGCNVVYAGFGGKKALHFCSTDCAKKWIDAEGSKYHDWAHASMRQNIQEIF